MCCSRAMQYTCRCVRQHSAKSMRDYLGFMRMRPTWAAHSWMYSWIACAMRLWSWWCAHTRPTHPCPSWRACWASWLQAPPHTPRLPALLCRAPGSQASLASMRPRQATCPGPLLPCADRPALHQFPAGCQVLRHAKTDGSARCCIL